MRRWAIVFGVAEVVDGDEVDVGALLPGGPEEVPADPAEAVDAHTNRHALPLSSIYPARRDLRASSLRDGCPLRSREALEALEPSVDGGLRRGWPADALASSRSESVGWRSAELGDLSERPAGDSSSPPRRCEPADRRAARSCAERLVRTRFAWSAFASRFASARVAPTTARLARARGPRRARPRSRAARRSCPAPRVGGGMAGPLDHGEAQAVLRREAARKLRPSTRSRYEARGGGCAARSPSRPRAARRAGRRRGSRSARPRRRGGSSSGARPASSTPASFSTWSARGSSPRCSS